MRNYTLQLLLLTVLLFTTSSLSAQGNDKLGSWYVYNGFFNFSPKTELFIEGQWRTYEPITNNQNIFFRPFFSYNIHPSFQIGIGQEYHMSYNYVEGTKDKTKKDEFRTTLQAIAKHKAGRVNFQHRYRYEFRFLENTNEQRARYRLQLGVPLSDKEMGKGVFFTTFGNEIILNTNPSLNLSQNRTYAMLGYQLTQSTHLQSGYMRINYSDGSAHNRLQFFVTQKLNFYDNN